jgi:hypothetical protein
VRLSAKYQLLAQMITFPTKFRILAPKFEGFTQKSNVYPKRVDYKAFFATVLSINLIQIYYKTSVEFLTGSVRWKWGRSHTQSVFCSLRAKVHNEYGEGFSAKLDWSRILGHQLVLFPGDFYWNWYHFIVNQILHSPQPTRKSTQIMQHIGIRKSWISS